MVQTMFDKYARRDERSPAGAMGRKELSQLSKDSGSARIDSVRSLSPRRSCICTPSTPLVWIEWLLPRLPKVHDLGIIMQIILARHHASGILPGHL